MDTSKQLTLKQAVAERIRGLLAERNLTQYRFEQISGITHGHLSHILYNKKGGSNNSLSLTTLLIIAQGFNMTMAEFLNKPIFNYENISVNKKI